MAQSGCAKRKMISRKATIRLFSIVAMACCTMLSACLAMDKRIFEKGCAEPRRTPEQITVSYSLPEQKHRYLGEITIQYGTGYDRPEIMRRLRVEAAKCGADGLLLGSFSRSDSKWKWSDKNINDSFDTSGYRLIVTLYRLEDSPTSP